MQDEILLSLHSAFSAELDAFRRRLAEKVVNRTPTADRLIPGQRQQSDAYSASNDLRETDRFRLELCFKDVFGPKVIMKKTLLSLLMLFAATVMFSTSAAAQTETFSDPNVDYSFVLPEPKWRKTVTPSATNPNVEYVYGDRVFGRLEVRKLDAPQSRLLADIVRDEDQKLQFLMGYAPGKQENFSGKLRGAIYNFEFVKGGRPMVGRFYFLRDGDVAYVLRFEGRKDSLNSIQNQMDSIARTFSTKSK